jgi:glycosyltransferase involved in cell wall biosynthesis
VERPEITIIMLVRDERATIAQALDSVLAQNGGSSFEVVIADGGSTDGTRALVETRAAADDRVRIIENPSGETARGLNAALVAARGEYWVRVDGHSEIPPHYAELLVEHIRSGRAAAAGAIVRGAGHSRFGRAAAVALDSHFGIGDSHHHHATERRYVDHVTHGAYRIDLSRMIGGFDAALVRNQDYDFDYRYRLTGAEILLDPSVTFKRRVRETPLGLWRQFHEYGYWKSVVLRRHPRSLHLRWLVPPALVSSLVGGTLLGRTRRGRRVLLLTSAAYGSFLGLATITLTRRNQPTRADQIALALATMHLSWGTGFLRGCLRRP